MRKLILFFIHLLIIVLLTAATQIGGFLWLCCLFMVKQNVKRYRLKRLSLFIVVYLVFTLLVVPITAPLFGREKIKNTPSLSYHTFFTVLFNRNYVTPQLQEVLQTSAANYQKRYPKLKIIYLDACFPFLDGFPLLPHLSHNDGDKIDIAFVYTDDEGVLTNKKPSTSGYGVFVESKNSRMSQSEICKSRGYFQYDFTKYLTFGSFYKSLNWAPDPTRFLINTLLAHKATGKLFIEPHLKANMRLTNPKVRFHGCQAVRHDDHIHLQLR